MRVGILVEAEEGLDWDRWRATYAAAERLGFESVWLSDHLRSPWSETQRGLETWTALAVAAAETRRVVLGPLVTPITFREPAIVARMVATVSSLAPDRFVAGLGLGWNAEEHAAAAIAFPSVAERARRLAETIERIRCEVADQHVPILIGGAGKRSTLPLVARAADEWNLTTGSVATYSAARDWLDARCGEIGRDPSAIRRSVATGILVGRDARDLTSRAERMRRCVPPLAEAEDVLGAARHMGWLVGTLGDVLGELLAFRAAGVDRAILGHYDLDDLSTLELVAEAIVPALT